jgi:ATP-binding cassette subfamily B multidrug efflux pump
MKKFKTDRKTIKKVLSYIGSYKWLLLLSIMLAGVSVAMTLYIPKLIGDTIDCIVGEGNVDFSLIGSIFIDIILATAAAAITQWLMNVINNRMTYQIVRDIRIEAFKKLEILPLSYLDSHSSGDIVSRIIADTDTFADGLLMGYTQLFTGVGTILGTIGFMLAIHPGIALVVLLVTPLSLVTAAFIAKRTYNMFKVQSQTRGEQTSFIDEMINGQKIVKAFGYEAKSQADFDEINERLRSASLLAIFFSSLVNPSTRFINSIVYTGVTLTGALAVISGNLSVGMLSSLLAYSNQYTKPFNEISGVVTELQNALACAARVFSLIEEPPQIPDKSDAAVLNDVEGAVAFENVYFSYSPEKKLIEDFNLNVKPGQRIAIVGPTGCGKTTLINLLMRFYDVDNGSIKVDGIDIRDITRKSLRQNFGMVLQDTWLSAGTIRDNIAMGKPDASDDEIIAAAKASHADNFIRRLPNGYATVIGDDGGGLSQGQKQLICIARVMLCLPPMLILDEATSSIDTRTEIRIQKAFEKLMHGRTSFIVAHRLSTIREADVILVMNNGHIVESGRHEELLKAGGAYAALYNSQFLATAE